MKKEIKKVAIVAAKKAGKILLREYIKFNRNEIKLKHHHEIITKADLMSEKIIISEINKFFPKHKILSEEAGKISGVDDYLWIIDPLDGTTNFSMHNPLFSISIGVVYKNKIILGIIYAPFLDELYIAQKDKKSTLNNKKIKVSKENKKAINTFCHAREDKHFKRALKFYKHQKLNGLDCRQLGSAAIELGYVAAGRTESITIPGVNSWDVAAGVLIVRKAGGKVTDFKGNEWNLSSNDMLASNGKVHGNLLKALKNI